MARRDFRVKARIEAEDRASGNVRKAESSFQRFGNFLRTNFAASLLSVTALITGFATALRAAIKASAEQELAVRKLDAALSPLGSSAAGVSKELQEYAAALQQTTQYGDETIIAGQALLASFTKNTEEIKAATKAALDLSAATGQNLQSAFLLLARAAAGETSMLSRYGITLDETIPKSEKFAAALAKINEQFGGQAEAQAKTFTGRLAQLSNAFGDLNEVVGDSITQNREATRALESMKTAIEGLQDEAKAAGTAFTLFVSSLIETGDVSSAFALALTKMVKGLIDTGDAAEIAAIDLSKLPKKMKESGDTAELTAAQMAKLRAELKAQAAAYDAAVNSAAAFGATTSIQLTEKIWEVATALEAQKRLLGESSAEYQKLEEIASAKIAALKARIENLRLGFGDLKDSTKESTDALGEYASAADAGASRIDDLTSSIHRSTQAYREQQSAAASAGRVVSGGGSQYGTTSFQFSGGRYTFVEGRRALVMPDGRVIFP